MAAKISGDGGMTTAELEIGCRSGNLRKLLTEFGYCGSYVGVDVADRFEPESQFDLTTSVSALEDIPDDRRLIQCPDSWLPACATIFAVCQPAGTAGENRHG